MENKILSNIFGIIGTVLWSVQLIPQIHLNYKRKSTKGVSPVCFGCWYACGLVLGTNLVYNDEPIILIIQISLFSLFALIIVFQHLFYQKKYNQKRLMFTLTLVILVSAAIIISIYSILNADRTNQFVVQLLLCITATALMAVGFFPQILEVWEEKVGLSKIFVVMDFFGGVFSILSLVFHEPFDYMDFATYVVVPICQVVIFLLILKVELKARKEGLKSETDTSFVPFVNDGDVSIEMDNVKLNEKDSLNQQQPQQPQDDYDEGDNENDRVKESILHSPLNKNNGVVHYDDHHHEEEVEEDYNNQSSPLRPLNQSFGSIHLNFKDTNALRESFNQLNQSTISIQMKSPLSNSTSIQSPLSNVVVPQRQEFDHVAPLSITQSTELLMKQQQHQQQQLQHQQQVLDSVNTHPQQSNQHTNSVTAGNGHHNHGYPDS